MSSSLLMQFSGYSFPSHPGDLFFIRGAALKHDCIDWDGSGPEDGRMVFAMFSDHRVFFREHVERPEDVYPLYHGKTHKFRKLFPPPPLTLHHLHNNINAFVLRYQKITWVLFIVQTNL